MLNRRVVHFEETEGLPVKNPHRMRIAREEHAILRLAFAQLVFRLHLRGDVLGRAFVTNGFSLWITHHMGAGFHPDSGTIFPPELSDEIFDESILLQQTPEFLPLFPVNVKLPGNICDRSDDFFQKLISKHPHHN